MNDIRHPFTSNSHAEELLEGLLVQITFPNVRESQAGRIGKVVGGDYGPEFEPISLKRSVKMRDEGETEALFRNGDAWRMLNGEALTLTLAIAEQGCQWTNERKVQPIGVIAHSKEGMELVMQLGDEPIVVQTFERGGVPEFLVESVASAAQTIIKNWFRFLKEDSAH